MKSPARFIVIPALAMLLASLACAGLQPELPAPTGTATPTSVTITPTPTSTSTPRPTATPRPTQTSNAVATHRAGELAAEVQAYYERGYLGTREGRFEILDDFHSEWAQLGWYKPYVLPDSAGDFFLSGHFRWDSALKNSDVAGCGFMFALQENGDHYAVFLDRTQVLFLMTDQTVGFSRPVHPTRGTGRVRFEYPAEADFTLIVRDLSAYTVVNGDVVGEYTIARSRTARGQLALTVLSGTNKDFGTRCEMSNLHVWLPAE